MNKYGIQIVSNLSGIGIHTIRKWEQRYKALTPERENNGRRLYSDEEIEKLQLLHELTTAGHSISKVAKLNNDELKNLLEKVSQGKTKKIEKIRLSEKFNILDFQKNLFYALENYKLDIISHELSKVKVLVSERTLVLEIIAPLLKEVGRRIYNGQLSLGKELALYSIIKFHMGQLIFRSYQHKFKRPQTIIFGTLENDPFEMDILLGSIISSHYGMKFYYLGGGLPLDSIIEASKALESNLIIIGVHELLNKGQEKNRIMYFERLFKKLPNTCNVCALGGEKSQWEKILSEKRFSFFSSLFELDQYLINL